MNERGWTHKHTESSIHTEVHKERERDNGFKIACTVKQEIWLDEERMNIAHGKHACGFGRRLIYKRKTTGSLNCLLILL